MNSTWSASNAFISFKCQDRNYVLMSKRKRNDEQLFFDTKFLYEKCNEGGATLAAHRIQKNASTSGSANL